MPKMKKRPEQEPAFMSLGEVAQFFGVSQMTVRRWQQAGKLQGYQLKPHGWWKFKREDVMNLLKPVDVDE